MNIRTNKNDFAKYCNPQITSSMFCAPVTHQEIKYRMLYTHLETINLLGLSTLVPSSENQYYLVY